MTTMTLRGIDEHLASTLKALARNQGVSLNTLALRLIREATGVDKRKRTLAHHDLDALAGTWSEEDEVAFHVATRSLETIDEDMWK
jgi:DNA polymerase III delta prime subunit